MVCLLCALCVCPTLTITITISPQCEPNEFAKSAKIYPQAKLLAMGLVLGSCAESMDQWCVYIVRCEWCGRNRVRKHVKAV